MKSKPIFSIVCRHSYYQGGVCQDFDLVATADTDRLLKSRHCLLRPRADGAVCLAELSDDGSLFIPVGPTETLSFNLILNNSSFGLITDLSALAKQTAPLFKPADADINREGSLQLSSRNQLLDNGVFATIEIPGLVFANPGAQTVQYFIDFLAKQARWLFYCVTDLNLAGKDLEVVDLETSGTPIVFSTTNRRDLAQSPDPNDLLAVDLASRYPEFARLRFASDGLVPSSESPRSLSFQLDGHNFPDILPAPSAQNLTAWPFTDQINTTQQDALFQVVKYVSYSFSKNGV